MGGLRSKAERTVGMAATRGAPRAYPLPPTSGTPCRWTRSTAMRVRRAAATSGERAISRTYRSVSPFRRSFRCA